MTIAFLSGASKGWRMPLLGDWNEPIKSGRSYSRYKKARHHVRKEAYLYNKSPLAVENEGRNDGGN